MMPFIVSTRRKVFSEGISEKTHILFHFNLSSGKPPAGKKATIWNSYRDMGDSPGNPLIEEANLSGLDERNRRSTPLMARMLWTTTSTDWCPSIWRCVPRVFLVPSAVGYKDDPSLRISYSFPSG
jgi:hypothetical protein